MLIIILHNNLKYLEHIKQLATTDGIEDSKIISRESIGIRLIGGDVNITFSRGKMYDAYNKAFVAVLDGKEKTKNFLDRVENDTYLEIANLQSRGFICLVPFSDIRDLVIKPAPSRKNEVKRG